jgi:hypothetical protein
VIWTIEYDSLVQKEMRKIDPQARQRIRAFLQERVAALDNPRQTGAALQGSDLEISGVTGWAIIASSAIYRIISSSCWWSKSAIAAKFTVRHS